MVPIDSGRRAWLVLLATLVTACGGGSGESPAATPAPPAAEPPPVPPQTGPFQVVYDGPVAGGVAVAGDGSIVFAPAAPGGFAALALDGRLRRYGAGRGAPVLWRDGAVLYFEDRCNEYDGCTTLLASVASDGTATVWGSGPMDSPPRGEVAVDGEAAVYLVGGMTFDGADGFIQRMDGPTDVAWVHEVSGYEPRGPLTPAADGWVYGVGGAPLPSGTDEEPAYSENVFRVSRAGTVERLAVFETTGEIRGLRPGLVVGDGGWIVGLASNTGAHGALYRMRTDGSGLAVAHTFAWGGVSPRLLRGADGHVYGTTREGGNGRGVVFRLRGDDGSFEVVHAFAADGDPPAGRLAQLPDGRLAGTTNRVDAGDGRIVSGSVYRLRLPD